MVLPETYPQGGARAPGGCPRNPKRIVEKSRNPDSQPAPSSPCRAAGLRCCPRNLYFRCVLELVELTFHQLLINFSSTRKAVQKLILYMDRINFSSNFQSNGNQLLNNSSDNFRVDKKLMKSWFWATRGPGQNQLFISFLSTRKLSNELFKSWFPGDWKVDEKLIRSM